MRSIDPQKSAFCKYEDDDGLTKIFQDLNGYLGLNTIKGWCQLTRDTGSIQLSTPPGGLRFVRTIRTIQKVKHRRNQKKKASV